jgi:hypothetical protein
MPRAYPQRRAGFVARDRARPHRFGELGFCRLEPHGIVDALVDLAFELAFEIALRPLGGIASV